MDKKLTSEFHKKRTEEDNKVIFERINNLEYIKAVSGEKYEEKKINNQLNSTFDKNKPHGTVGLFETQKCLG